MGVAWGKASYKGKSFAIKQMKTPTTSIIELTVLLKTSNSPNLLNTKIVGVSWPRLKNSEIIVGLELCDSDLRSILPLSHTKFKLISDIIVGSCQAVAQLANLSIKYRDIKPENIIIKGGVAKLGDFGFAVLGNSAVGYFGNPGYIAPEVLLKKVYNNSCDMWSV